MPPAVHKIAELNKIIADAEKARGQLYQARKGEAGEVVEKLGLLDLTDDALAGALSLLVGASPKAIAELEAKGATFLGKRRGKGRTTSGDDKGADGEAAKGAAGVASNNAAE